jgi:hypothetical protein
VTKKQNAEKFQRAALVNQDLPRLPKRKLLLQKVINSIIDYFEKPLPLKAAFSF